MVTDPSRDKSPAGQISAAHPRTISLSRQERFEVLTRGGDLEPVNGMLVHIVDEVATSVPGAPASLRSLCGAPVEGFYVRNKSSPGRSKKNLCPACLQAAVSDGLPARDAGSRG